MKRRKIAVVTTSRADYGLLYWILRGIQRDRALDLRLIVTGSHLCRRFGHTVTGVLRDGFPVAARVRTLSDSDPDTDAAVIRAIARGVAGFGSALERLSPDLLLLLGDRYELLAAAAAAAAARIPIVHLHGGESTEGVMDEQVRHAVTKLAHLHCAAAAPYRRRIIQMGEAPSNVLLTGAPGLEYIARLVPTPLGELERLVGLRLDGPFVVLTQHPLPCRTGRETLELDEVLSAVRSLRIPVVMTYANADRGGRRINARIAAFARAHPDFAAAVPSLGQQAYLSLLRRAAAIVGNSSSGVHEAPTLRVPTINVGERQAGRLRAPSIIDCPPERVRVVAALRRALSSAFRRERCTGRSPYLGGRVSERVLRILRTVPLGDALLRKKFHDLPCGKEHP
ncbi:MAG: UDP-N-acetylglucosamine 2-epimerase [Elusimicrobiota bacterium]|jgi:UDP-hydrolysing UDP-N-acetyl-D-glucosamine 2-epimerase